MHSNSGTGANIEPHIPVFCFQGLYNKGVPIVLFREARQTVEYNVMM